MSVLRNLESKLAGLVEGTFSRAFKSEVRPVEIARKLAREMDEHRVQSLSRTYVPNEYAVWLSPEDREQFSGYEDELRARAVRLPARARPARARRAAHAARDHVQDRRAAAAGRVRHPGAARAARTRTRRPSRARPRRATRWSTRPRTGSPSRCASPTRGAATARLRIGGRAELLGSGGATLGRSREADIVLDDANVSRKHAEVRPSGGSWIVRDLGSTNGVKVNGRRLDPSRPQSLKPGDVIELGTSRATFELE